MKSRRITVRRIDPDEDRGRILAVLERNLPDAAAPERLEWLYLSNPDGPALAWIAEDEAGEPVGTSAAHPRRVRLGGKIVRALNLSDFAFDPGYRSLGPALQLLRATLEPVREGAFELSYDFPSASMRAIYLRMGGIDLGPTERWVRPVRLSGIVERRLGKGLVGTVAGAAGDAALRTRDTFVTVPRGLEVGLLEGDCGAEFDDFDARAADRHRVQGVRDGAYLNWRYLRHTMWRHRLLCAREGGALSGFAVLRYGPGTAFSLVDVRAGDDERVCRGLLARLLEAARDAGAESVQAQALQGSAYADLLKKLGFLPREQGPGPVPVPAPAHARAGTLDRRESWWLTEGDRDI